MFYVLFTLFYLPTLLYLQAFTPAPQVDDINQISSFNAPVFVNIEMIHP